MALGNLIKTWENIMRDDDGVNGTVQVLSQLVWMLFLRVYDLKEDMWELYEDDFESAIPEECRWRNWARGKSQKDQMTGDALVDFVDNTLFPTLKGLTVTAESSKRQTIVKEMMAESYNYMKDGVCIRKAVNLLEGINFDNQEEHHTFNTIYETLLRGLQSAGRSGEFYTPRALTQLITEKVNPELGKVTADFACGTGGFLIDAVEHLRKQVKKAEDAATIEKTVFGVEKKQFPFMLCTTNMLLHDVDYPRVSHDNSLNKNVRDYPKSGDVDYILMNPPYGGHEQDGIQINFPSKLRSSETANLFMIEILYRLKENGRCGVILPDGFLQNDDASLIEIKRKLFAENNVHTIIRMPGSCFAPYTPIATNLLFFDKTGSTKETWFYRFDLPNGNKFSMVRNPIVREKLVAIDEWWDNRTEIKDKKEDESLTETWKSKCVPIKTIEEGNYNLDFCGFPNEERIVLSPEETLEIYETERGLLEKELSISTMALKDALNGKRVELHNIARYAQRLSELNSRFPNDMRAAILQAAMQGKITERQEKDTAVDDTIVIARNDRKKLIEDKVIKQEKLDSISSDDYPYEIPESWRFIRLGEVIKLQSGQDLTSDLYSDDVREGIPYLTGASNINNGEVIINRWTTHPRAIAEKGDLLLTCKGTVGLLAFLQEDKVHIARQIMAIKTLASVNLKYIMYCLDSFILLLKSKAKSEIPGIDRKVVLNLLVPLPPIEEQERIVQRLDCLLPACDIIGE